MRTFVHADERGVVLARWIYGPSEAVWLAKLDGLVRSGARAVTLWSVTEREPIMFEAAYSGPDAERRIVLPLEVAVYQVATYVVRDNEVGMVIHTIESAR